MTEITQVDSNPIWLVLVEREDMESDSHSERGLWAGARREKIPWEAPEFCCPKPRNMQGLHEEKKGSSSLGLGRSMACRTTGLRINNF